MSSDHRTYGLLEAMALTITEEEARLVFPVLQA